METAENPLSQDLDELFHLDPSLWENLQGAHLFITGGTGFWGRWLLESLLWAENLLGLGSKVLLLTRNPNRFRQEAPHLASHQSVTILEGDVRSFAFPDFAPTHVLHLATDTSAEAQRSNPWGTVETIVQGTRRVFEYSSQRGGVDTRILLASSGAIYGSQPHTLEAISEEYSGAPDPLAAGSAYGLAKRLAEHLGCLHLRQTGQCVTIARGFAFAGPGIATNSHFAFGNFVRDCLANGPIRIAGDGRAVRSYLYASDLAWWLWTILLRGAPGRAWNVGGKTVVSIVELARTAVQAWGIDLPIELGQAPQPEVQPHRYVPDVKRAFVELGLEERIPLKAMFKRTFEWNLKRSR